MIQSQTSTGVVVTLTGVEDLAGKPAVRVEFVLPGVGAQSFTSSQFGVVGSRSGMIGWLSDQRRVCLTVPRADFDAALVEARAIGLREVEALKSGAKRIELRWSAGEYLSGHVATCARAADLLVELGLAKAVDGWGVFVEPQVAEALGSSFTHAQAVELARPAREAAGARAAAAAGLREARRAEAAATGREVELKRWTEGCCERDFDCSLDVMVEYALPDGGTRVERTHTH